MNLKNKFFLVFILSITSLVISACSDSSDSSNSNNSSKSEMSDIEWPEEEITINIHADTGNLDTAIRQISPLIEDELDAKIKVENRPGGGQAISQTDTQSKEADGYTFQTITSSTTFGMATGQIPFGPEDWKMVSSLQLEPAAIAVLDDSPLEDIDDFVDTMKENPNDLTVGGYQSDGYMRYVYYKLQKSEDFEGKWIPIDTTDEVATNLLGGHIDVAVMTPSTALSAIEDGDIRLLGIASEDQIDTYKGVETFQEQGYDMVEVLYRGLIAKDGTPKEVIDKMHETIKGITENNDEWNKFQESQNQINDNRTPKELDENLKQEVEDRKEFVKELGLD